MLNNLLYVLHIGFMALMITIILWKALEATRFAAALHDPMKMGFWYWWWRKFKGDI